MCVVSYVGDRSRETFPQSPWYPAVIPQSGTAVAPFTLLTEERVKQLITEALVDVKGTLESLRVAIAIDQEHGDDLCGEADKFAVLREVADALDLGGELDEIFAQAGIEI